VDKSGSLRVFDGGAYNLLLQNSPAILRHIQRNNIIICSIITNINGLVYIVHNRYNRKGNETLGCTYGRKALIMNVLIIIPAYNEAGIIEWVVDNLIINYPHFDYIVVNDGSKDDTSEICRRNGYNLLDLPVNIGLSGAVQAGMKYAEKLEYDAVLQFDGDGQHDPAYIQPMVNQMVKTGADIVIGSRFKTVKKSFNPRMLGSRVIHCLVRLTTGYNMTDPTSGMRLYSMPIAREFANNINYGPEPDTIAYLLRNGVSLSEVQVGMNERKTGESYLNWAGALRYMMRICSSIVFIQWFRKRSI